MKKIILTMVMLIIVSTVNSQNYFIGVGLDKGFIIFPDYTRNYNTELLISGQLNKRDMMVSFGFYENSNTFSISGWYGYNVCDWFSIGGCLGYELSNSVIHIGRYEKIQSDMLIFGAYFKFTICKNYQLFTFYKIGYDNNSNIKWQDRGFGVGVSIGFAKKYNEEQSYRRNFRKQNRPKITLKFG